MTWVNDIHTACGLNADEHDWDPETKCHICPAWHTERSAA